MDVFQTSQSPAIDWKKFGEALYLHSCLVGQLFAMLGWHQAYSTLWRCPNHPTFLWREDISWTYLGHIWDISGTNLEYIKDICDISGTYLEHIQDISWLYLWTRFVQNLTGSVLGMIEFGQNMTEIVLNVAALVLNMTWVVLNVTEVVLNETEVVLNVTKVVLNVTWVVLTITWFVLNTTGFTFKKILIWPKYDCVLSLI